MVDAVLAFPPGHQFQDGNGEVYNGGKVYIYDSGTTNDRTSYSDSGLTSANANPIILDAAGRLPDEVYLPTGAWKVVLDDSADATVFTADAIIGALDTSPFLTGTVAPSRAVISKSTTFTTIAGEVGKHINADSTGGSFTGTLLSAVTATDGGDFLIKNSGTENTVTVATTGGQTIDGQSTYLLQAGDSAVFRSDGANYSVGEAHNFTAGIVTLNFADPLTPSFQYGTGTDYQLTLTADIVINAPTNLRVGTQGIMTMIQDATGGHAVTLNSVFKGNISIDQTANAVNIIGFKVRSATDIDVWMESGRFFLAAIIDHQETAGTNAGAATAGSFETRTLNTVGFNRLGVSVATNKVTVPIGNYMIRFDCPSVNVNRHVSQLYDTTAAASLETGTSEISAGASSVTTRSVGIWVGTLSVASDLEIRAQVQTTNATDGAGQEANLGVVERYARMEIYAR